MTLFKQSFQWLGGWRFAEDRGGFSPLNCGLD